MGMCKEKKRKELWSSSGLKIFSVTSQDLSQDWTASIVGNFT